MKHIIWDWNGTLLNDLPLMLDAVNHTVTEIGLRQITLDDYRTFYTRPVKRFYDQIADREITDDEFALIDRLFHEFYHSRVHQARLADHAHGVLAEIDASDHSQSLLSMAPNDELQMALGLFDVKQYFPIAQGNTGLPGGFKARHLANHLHDLGVDPRSVTMIGDTVDDANAAIENGIDSVLYDDGSHHRADLEAVGVPIADSLVSAAEIALGG